MSQLIGKFIFGLRLNWLGIGKAEGESGVVMARHCLDVPVVLQAQGCEGGGYEI